MTIFYSAFALSVVSISFSFVINNFLIYWLNFPELFNLFIDFRENNNDSFNKNIFNTSIKESNGIILLKKFLFKSQNIND